MFKTFSPVNRGAVYLRPDSETQNTMAKIKFSAWLTDARGKQSGTVFSKNRYGAYTRNRVTPVNPQTASQTSVRNFLTTLAQAWRALTANQRSAWNAAANQFLSSNIFADVIRLSGFNLFLRLNRNLQSIGVATINSPPVPGSVFGLTTLSVVADTTGAGLDITFTAAIPVSDSVIVEATAPQSAGKSFFKSEYRIISILTSADASPQDEAAPYIVKFGALPPVGTKIGIRMTGVNETTGQAGTSREFQVIAT